MSRRILLKAIIGILVLQLTSSLSFGQDYERAGWEAQLSTFSHNIAGTVRILDHDSLEIEGFYYDGGGPAVYLYLAEENTDASFEAGIPIGPLLTGTQYEDSTIVVDLPEGQSLDGYNAVSVWCVDFRVNFGSGVFGSVVEYSVVFDATWSADTHQNFPPNPHFSGLIGAAHNQDITFWAEGGLASDGIKSMAETGSKFPLTTEVNTAISIGYAYSLISGPGIGVSPNTATKVFKMNSSHPQVTLVTMIAPSPDWFVGVTSEPLFENGKWIAEKVIELAPYDAGTDSGSHFTSSNSPTFPRDPITELTGFPFENDPPLGTFTFTLMCKKSPVGDLNGDCRVDFTDFALMASNWLVDCNVSPTHPTCQ